MELSIEQIIAMARHWTGNTNQSPIRDGFVDDPAEFLAVPLTYITFANIAQNELLKTGYLKCDDLIQLTAGRKEYGLDPWVHTWINVWYKGKKLIRTSTGELDRLEDGWRNAASGTPRYFYFYSDQIGLHPTPSVNDPNDTSLYSLVIRADADLTAFDGTDRTVKPARLPSRFHPLLAVGMAYMIKAADQDNESAVRSAGFLKNMWDKGQVELKEVIQQREESQTDQITVHDYRRDQIPYNYQGSV